MNDPRREWSQPATAARTYSRRAVLRAALAGAALVPGSALLAACARGGTPAPTDAPISPLIALPTAAATATPRRSVVDGQLPAPAPGVPDAYTKWPPPYRSVAAAPGRGGTVSTLPFYGGNQLLVPQRAENRYWQALEQRLGATLAPIVVPPNAYFQKLFALTASRDLPDLIFHFTILQPDHFKAFKEGAYADLTPYLTGAALADYPNLATFPARSWQSIALGGKLYGVPYPAPPKRRS